MKRMKGFTLIELLIVVAIIAILAAIAVPNFLEAQVRSKVSRVKADQRSLATGIEAYYVDNNDYPGYASGASGANGFIGTGPGAFRIYTFRVWDGTDNDFRTLTSPQAYLTSYFGDPFADTKGCAFAYYCDDNGWIVASFGPNTDEVYGGDLCFSDIDGYKIETIYDARIAQPSVLLITGSEGGENNCHTYDPTNGTVTAGDVYRVKE